MFKRSQGLHADTARDTCVYVAQMAFKAWEHLLVAYLPQPGPDAPPAPEQERIYANMIRPVLRIMFKMVPGNGVVKESTLRGPHDRHLLLSEVDMFPSALYCIMLIGRV